VNAGIYVFQRSVIGGFPRGRSLSLEEDVFPGLAGKALYAFRVDAPVLDIGTPGRYRAAQRRLGRLVPGNQP
jgi:NDP-sugar pyrophosphorylase family protein